MSELEDLLAFQMSCTNVPAPVREHKFDPDRKWRFDFAWPKVMLAVEIDGGTYVKGRHVRPQGFEQDCEKLNAAALAGWTVLRFTERMVDSGAALEVIERAMDAPA